MDQAILESEAMRLSPQQRALLADALLVSLDDEEIRAGEAAWACEAEVRRSAYLRGEIAALDGTDAVAGLRAGFKP
jgi:propanediol dehydratase large subunit